jgi:hypothetical protein
VKKREVEQFWGEVVLNQPVMSNVSSVSSKGSPVSTKVSPESTKVSPVSAKVSPVSTKVSPVSIQVSPFSTKVRTVSGLFIFCFLVKCIVAVGLEQAKIDERAIEGETRNDERRIMQTGPKVRVSFAFVFFIFY